MSAGLIIARGAALLGVSLPWWPAAVLGAQPYRPWLLARRLGALDDLVAVDAGLAWILDLLVVTALVSGILVLLPRRMWRRPARLLGGVLLAAGVALLVITRVAATLAPGTGTYLAVAVGAVISVVAWWPEGRLPVAGAGSGSGA